jgi:hypothetical protein
MSLTGKKESGDEGNRTPNPCLAKAVLCQLSYVPASETSARILAKIGRGCGLVPQRPVVLRGLGPLREVCRPTDDTCDQEELLQHGTGPFVANSSPGRRSARV